jgi:AspT/YidE/YbjL antiporter-like protein
VGLKGAVGKVGGMFGRVIRPSTATDLLTLSFGMILGFLIGAISFPAFGAPVGLGNAGGLLVSGVIVSSVVARLRFGNTQAAARNVLEDLGLIIFVAIAGINAGASLLEQLIGAIATKIFLVGFVACGEFRLGPVTGSLLAGLLIGHFAEVPVSGMLKSFLFLLFLFGIGYSVGPQFMQAARRDELNSIISAFVCTTTGLLVAWGVARFLKLDAGLAAGLLSGALTQSAAMGTASETIGALPLPEADRALLVAHVAVADAVCYVFGAVGAIWFCSDAAPKLLRVDLKAEARALEKHLGGEQAKPGFVSGYVQFSSSSSCGWPCSSAASPASCCASPSADSRSRSAPA